MHPIQSQELFNQKYITHLEDPCLSAADIFCKCWKNYSRIVVLCYIISYRKHDNCHYYFLCLCTLEYHLVYRHTCYNHHGRNSNSCFTLRYAVFTFAPSFPLNFRPSVRVTAEFKFKQTKGSQDSCSNKEVTPKRRNKRGSLKSPTAKTENMSSRAWDPDLLSSSSASNIMGRSGSASGGGGGRSSSSSSSSNNNNVNDLTSNDSKAPAAAPSSSSLSSSGWVFQSYKLSITFTALLVIFVGSRCC